MNWTPVEQWVPVPGVQVFVRLEYAHHGQPPEAAVVNYDTAVYTNGLPGGAWIHYKKGRVTDVMAIPEKATANADQT